MTARPRLAITLGDPRGVGPEITRALMTDPPPRADFVVIGPDNPGWEFPDYVAVGSFDAGDIASCGGVAGKAIQVAVEMALSGEVAGIVTAPIDKSALLQAGYRHAGHTELLAELAGNPDVAMMLASDRLRVVLATTHIPLRVVPERLTGELLERTVAVTREGLRSLYGMSDPRIALCGFNPHLGEGGVVGDEDQRILEPAARRAGVAGPYSADTVFVRAMKGEFDAVIAPYHDVGMTAIKVASFGSAVNVTLGLPFVRTSPDHGTAMDIVGTGRADPGPMRRAVEEAIALVQRGRGFAAGVQSLP